MFDIDKFKKIPFIISGIVFLASLIALFSFGLKLGIDFTGGSLMELRFRGERPSIEQMESALQGVDVGEIRIQPAGEDSYFLRMPFLSEPAHQAVLRSVRDAFPAEQTTSTSDGETITESTSVAPSERVVEERIETIGPSISSQLQERSIEAGIAVMLAIIAYVAYAFRRVSKPVQSWKYGVTAIIALTHDVVITMGVFALLGHFSGVEVGVPFVVALLTILGYSVNDSIVVFDRIRERLIELGPARFTQAVQDGLNSTLLRSFNTSVTTLLVLIAMYAFGGATIHYFALALIIGILSGTYSSIFLASPLLLVWEKMRNE